MQNDNENMFWKVFAETCAMKHVAPSRAIRDMGLSVSAYTKWKSGTMPHDTTIRKIAEHFNLEYDRYDSLLKGFTHDDPNMRERTKEHWKEFLKQIVYRSTLTDEEKRERDERQKQDEALMHRWDSQKLIRSEKKFGYFDNVFELKTKTIPLLGKISCGQPIFINEEKGEYYAVSEDVSADFCLQARGDSMIGARIYDGDIVFCRYQPTVENGEIAAVAINDEALLKRFYFDESKRQITLVPENPAYEPMVFTGADVASVRVLGKAVAFQSRNIK